MKDKNICQFNLRPHHGLCIFHYKGNGYSPEFTENMTRTISLLQGNPVIRIRSKPDILCIKCPHLIEGVCESQEKVCRYNNFVLALCKLTEDSEISWLDFKKAITENILEAGKFDIICTNCKWAYICHSK